MGRTYRNQVVRKSSRGKRMRKSYGAARGGYRM